MTTLTHIFIHHYGGYANDPYAPTSHLSFEDIDSAHYLRWPEFRSQLGYFVGYNFIIFPNGGWKQARIVGEETAANKGWNKNAASICLAGNFDINPSTKQPVERPTEAQKRSLSLICEALLEKTTSSIGIIVLQGTTFDFKLENIKPHRAVAQTDCNGNSLSDTWARDIMRELFGKKLTLLQQLVSLYEKLLALMKKKPLGGSDHDDPYAPPAPCWTEDNHD